MLGNMAVAGALFSWNSVTHREHLQSAEEEANVTLTRNARGFRNGGEKCGVYDGVASEAFMIQSLVKTAFGELASG